MTSGINDAFRPSLFISAGWGALVSMGGGGIVPQVSYLAMPASTERSFNFLGSASNGQRLPRRSINGYETTSSFTYVLICFNFYMDRYPYI